MLDGRVQVPFPPKPDGQVEPYLQRVGISPEDFLEKFDCTFEISDSPADAA